MIEAWEWFTAVAPLFSMIVLLWAWFHELPRLRREIADRDRRLATIAEVMRRRGWIA